MIQSPILCPLTPAERDALPLAAEMSADIAWALAIVRDLHRWQSAFT